MDRMEYLSRLGDNLSSLPQKERDAALKYYDDLFEDAGIMNEQDVIASLGPPNKLAHTILNDKNRISYEFGKTKKKVRAARKKMTANQSYAAVAIIIVTLPLWLSLIIVFGAVIAAVFLSAAFALAALAVSGAALICMGVAYINRFFSIFLALFGSGIVFISLAFLLFTPIMHFVLWLVRFIVKKTVMLLNKILGRSEV